MKLNDNNVNNFVDNSSDIPLTNNGVQENNPPLKWRKEEIYPDYGVKNVLPTREYRTNASGVLEKFYVYTCPNCGEKKELLSIEHDNMQDNTQTVCAKCSTKFILTKQTAADYKAPSLMDSFGEFFKKGTTPEELSMLPEKELQDVLNAIRDTTGIEINKETIEKLPVGIKRILKDVLNI